MRSSNSPSRDVTAEAAVWLARLHADDRSADDEAGFRAWLAADPSHASAFEAVDQTWTIVGSLPREFSRGGPNHELVLNRRRALLAGVGLIVVAGGSFSFLRSSSAKVYETAIGEQKHVSLQDGSQLFMNAQTRVAVKFSDTEREVSLEFGRVNFRVVPDTMRPFVVEAARRRIITSQCNFDVHCEDGTVQVVLIHGNADIQRVVAASASAPATPRETLYAGERLVASDGADRRDKPNMAPLLAWQTGSAIFENQTLAEAVVEMNRYSSQKLEIADDRAAGLRVSGVYRVGDNAAFARSIAKLLPIDIDRQGDTLLLTIDESGTRG